MRGPRPRPSPAAPGEFTKTTVSVITSASVGHRGSSHRLGYVLAAALASMAGGTPLNRLYVLYQKQTGFGPLGVTVVFSAFVIGALLALLALGDLSDHVGRVHAGRPPRTGSRRTVFLADGPGNLTSNRHYIVTAARSTLVIPEGDDHHD